MKCDVFTDPFAQTSEVILTGDAEVRRGRDIVSGDRITFWLDKERMTCEPGRLVIYSITQ